MQLASRKLLRQRLEKAKQEEPDVKTLNDDAKNDRIAELEEALRPFVRLCQAYMTFEQRDDHIIFRHPEGSSPRLAVKYPDYRRAKKALEGSYFAGKKVSVADWDG